MMDWFVILTPLLLLPIVWLLGFVGCSIEAYGELEAPPATQVKNARLSWTSAKTTIDSIAFSCTVFELDKNGAPTGASFTGQAVGPAAFPPAHLPSSSTAPLPAPVTVELPPASKYRVEATVGVTWGGQFKQVDLSKTFAGGAIWDVVDWDFLLHDDPQADWALS